MAMWRAWKLSCSGSWPLLLDARGQRRRDAVAGVVLRQPPHTTQGAAHGLAGVAFVLELECFPLGFLEAGPAPPHRADGKAADVAECCDTQAQPAEQAERLQHQHAGRREQAAPVGRCVEPSEQGGHW
jgi:hypothetical protein